VVTKSTKDYVWIPLFCIFMCNMVFDKVPKFQGKMSCLKVMNRNVVGDPENG